MCVGETVGVVVGPVCVNRNIILVNVVVVGVVVVVVVVVAAVAVTGW